MSVVLLKNVSKQININEQQRIILKYAKTNGIYIKSTEVEISNLNLPLEDRKELKGFLRSLSEDSNVLIYDTWVFSSNINDLIKILKCLLERNIKLHICVNNEIISNSSSAINILSLLDSKTIDKRTCSSLPKGRPKGRMSKSKFDCYRAEILSYLEKDISINKIAQKLGLSRSSLKDYINSRGLKELATVKASLNDIKPTKIVIKKHTSPKCDLIKEFKERRQNV